MAGHRRMVGAAWRLMVAKVIGGMVDGLSNTQMQLRVTMGVLVLGDLGFRTKQKEATLKCCCFVGMRDFLLHCYVLVNSPLNL